MKKIISMLILILASASANAATYVVVSNDLRGMNFSVDEIRKILLGEKKTVKGSRLTLVYQPYASDDMAEVSKFLGKSNTRKLKSYWSKMIFTGRASHPKIAKDANELKDYMQENNHVGVSPTSTGFNVIYTIQ